MEKINREVIILPRFQTSLIGIWHFIANDSLKQADIFLRDIEQIMNKIEHYPEANPVFKPLDGLRKLYRYKIFKKNYFIVYKLLNTKLIYIRVVHSKQNPEFYKTLRTVGY